MKIRLFVITVFLLALCRIMPAAQDVTSAYGGQFDQSDDQHSLGNAQSIPFAPDVNSYDANPNIVGASAGVYQVGLATGFSTFLGHVIYVDYTLSTFGDTNHQPSINATNPSGAKPVLTGFTPLDSHANIPANFNFSQFEAGPVPEEVKGISLDSRANTPVNFDLSEAEAAAIPGLTEAIPEPGVCAMVFLGVGVLALWRSGPLLAGTKGLVRARVRKMKSAQA